MISLIFSDWEEEINSSLLENRSLCVALFSCDGQLLFANNAMKLLFKDEPHKSILHPSFDRLIETHSDSPLVYSGFITIGDYSSVNTSILAHAYRKDEKILIIGGVEANQLVIQNNSMHNLNREIGNLQRQLIKEKHTLEITLQQLNEANISLKELNATKDKLLSIIAHDLRNPFHYLLNFSELLVSNLDDFSTDEIKKFAGIIHNTSQQAHKLLENLLEWSRSQTGKLIAHPEEVYPEEIANEVKMLCEKMAKSKKINLCMEIPCNDCIYADEEMSKTVLRNLVTNALKFTFPDGTVTIGTKRIDEYVMFTVTDTGIGINPGNIDRIFQIDKDTPELGTANEKGTGLGLVLCKDFVEKQGGTISVESQLGVGSTFSFTLPFCKFK